MEWKELKRINEGLKTVDVKGKDYVEVNKRVMAFRELEPNGSITTEIISLENGVVVMKATAISGDGKVLGTGFAYEKESSSYINKTSYIENCETSAVGRALGMCGFGIDTSVCSAEELQNALNNQDKPNKEDKPKVEYATEEQRDKLVRYYSNKRDALDRILQKRGVTNIVQLKKDEAQKIIENVEAAMKEAGIPIKE